MAHTHNKSTTIEYQSKNPHTILKPLFSISLITLTLHGSLSKPLTPHQSPPSNQTPPSSKPLLHLHSLTITMSLLTLILLSLPLLTNAAIDTTMDPKEREVLFKIMYSLSSDRDWRNSNPNPCQSPWPGIDCKPLPPYNLLRVTSLHFGTHPYPKCTTKPTTFPSLIFTLPYLNSLFFFNCFNNTPTTTLSFPLKPHTSLLQLTLKSNPSLVGPIPPQMLSNLPSLQLLTLSQNRLTGKIPDTVSVLTSLIHLDLSYNSLSGQLPVNLGRLTSLVDLDLSYNSLSGPIPHSIGQMGQLQKLDLSSNSLTGPIPETLCNLSNLTFLALTNNRLNGEFPKGLVGLRSVQYLLMDGNPMFVSLPVELGWLERLVELRLANSGYSGSIPGSFGGLMNLTTLSLEDNRLTGEIPVALGGLARLYHLNLSRNVLSGVVPFGDGFIRRLGRNLDLSGNPALCVDGAAKFEGEKLGVGVCRGGNRGGDFPLHQAEMGGASGCACCGCFGLGLVVSVLVLCI